MALTDYLERGFLINPDGICLEMEERRFTYREVSGLVNRIARALDAAGYGIGTHAAVLSANDPLGYVCTLGVMRAGMTYVPLDFRNSADDNERILDFSDTEVLFHQRRFADQVRTLLPRLPKIRVVICIDGPDGDVPGLAQWIERFSDSEPEWQVPTDAIAWLQTGSGTSGDFRIAMMSHRAYHAFVAFQQIWLPDPSPVMLVAAPITHAGGGLSYQVLARGGRIVLLEKPDPRAVLTAIERHRITQVFLPPTVIYRLLDEPDVERFDYGSLKYMIYSAAPMAVGKLKRALQVFGPVMAQAFGQTEMLGIANLSPDEHYVNGEIAPDSRLSACGRPGLPFCKVAIMSDENVPLPRGRTGEICARGDQMMSGYYKNPIATRRTIVDGWLHTGDIGYFDEEGYLRIVDRRKDVIISGGFNVYPGEIEQVIASIEGVQDCAVIGVPDPQWGEAVKAVVEPSPGRTLRSADIVDRCRELLGGVKTPKSVDFVAELPRSTRGKVLKRVLRDAYWSGESRRI